MLIVIHHKQSINCCQAFSHELLPYFRDEQGLPRTARDSSGIPITEGHW